MSAGACLAGQSADRRRSQAPLYFRPVADIPLTLDPSLAPTLAAAIDVEGKIARALDILGPIGGRDVVVVGAGESEQRRLAGVGGRLTSVPVFGGNGGWPIPDGSADALVASWSGFRGVDPAELAEADRILRPSGRLLVVHDYGRDDVSRLRGDQPEYRLWSRRDGPFLSSGFRIRVLHCFWTFESVEVAREFITAAFGEAAADVAAELKRPRLSYNVAVYHRSRGEGPALD